MNVRIGREKSLLSYNNMHEMKKLLSTGNLTYQIGTEVYTLEEDFLFYHDDYGVIKVPAGYETDLASVPDFFFWWSYGPWDFGAIVHDYGYEFHELIIDDVITPMTKKQLDKIFLDINLTMGQDKVSAYLMYWALAFFGDKAFNRKFL